MLDEVRILHLPESVFLRCMLGLMAVSAWVGWEDGDGAASTAVPRFCNVLCRFMVVAQIKAPPQLASPPYDAFLARLLPAAVRVFLRRFSCCSAVLVFHTTLFRNRSGSWLPSGLPAMPQQLACSQKEVLIQRFHVVSVEFHGDHMTCKVE